MTEGKYAVLDLGTNTFNLLIMEIKGGKTHILEHLRSSVKIGAGGIQNNIITEAAFERAIDTILEFKNVINSFKISELNITAIATSAFRNAKNGEHLAKSILETSGIHVKIIQGEKEAELIYYGVKAAMDIGFEPTLIMDIGGGSVEFIICNHVQIFWKQSFEIGAQRMFDKYHTSDPILQSSIDEMQNLLSVALSPLSEAMATFHPKILVGSSGSFDTLCEIYLEEHSIKHNLYEGTEYDLPIHYFGELYYKIISKNVDERRKIKGMSPMRVDMIVVAMVMIDYVLKTFFMQRIRVSFYSLKEGVMYLMANDKIETLKM